MKRFSLRSLFFVILAVSIVLATGRYWVARGFVDNYTDCWVPQVSSLLPILEARTQFNGQVNDVCFGDLYSFCGYEAPYLGVIQLGCLPKTYEIDPDGNRFEFTERDTASISVRTIFGWSHFDIRRYRNKLTITQRYR